MTKLVELIQRIALNVIEASKPVEVLYGKVISLTPFQVQLSQKQILEKDFFIVRRGETVNSFEKGDILILFRVQGGQQYLIYGKKGAL